MKRYFPPSIRLPIAITIALVLFLGTGLAISKASPSTFPVISSGFAGIFGSLWGHPAPVIFEPGVSTDKNDYAPGEEAQISGSGFAPNELVTLLVVHITPPGTESLTRSRLEVADHAGHTPWQVVTDADGNFKTSWLVQEDSLDQMLLLSADQDATTEHDALHADAIFTDGNASADLDQCENDPAPSSNLDGCNSNANQWVNGNLGESKSVYLEGDSIPYRMRFGELDTTKSHTVIIEWDTTKSGKHAIDYLTTFNRTVGNANPCLGVSGCGSPSTTSIPKDPQVDDGSGSPIEQAAGVFTLYGGTITGVNAPAKVGNTVCGPSNTSGKYCYSKGTGFTGDKSAAIAVTFTTTVANPVLAWGGHIAQRRDGNGSGGWGDTEAAVSIPGSPYHTSLVDLDGSGGNQDRSLSAAAVIFPGSITIIKDANPNGPTDFAFSGSPSPLSGFSLDDDSDSTLSNTQVFSNITNFQTYNVAESVPSLWTLDTIVCGVTSANGGKTTVTKPSVAIDLAEGENVTCTFSNSNAELLNGRIQVVKATQPNPDPTDTDFNFSSTGFTLPDTVLANGESSTSDLLAPNASYSVSEINIPSAWELVSVWCVGEGGGSTGTASGTGISGIAVVAGETTVCTFTNGLKPKLTVKKHVVNDNGGTRVASEFTMHVKTGGADVSGSSFAGSESGTTFTLNPGTFVASENTPPTGYSQTGISGDCDSVTGSVTLAYGDDKTCTITNDDDAPALHLRKTVINDNGGTAAITNWTLTATGAAGTPTNLSGTTPVDSDATFKADTYALAENNGPANYTAGAWSCPGATMPDATHVTVPLGGNITCTINNDDNAPKLTLNKIVVNNNGGTASESAWTLTATGNPATSPATLSGLGAAGNADVVSGGTFDAGTYDLSESGPEGYTASDWSCTGGQTGTQARVTVALGDDITCTITNDDNAAHLIVIKHVVNDNGGTKSAANFTTTITGVTTTNQSAAGAESPGIDNTLTTVGLYSVDEGAHVGYDKTLSADCSGTIALGQTKTCTITNDDQAAHLVVIKHVTNDNGGGKSAGDFSTTITGVTTANPTAAGVESPGVNNTLTTVGSYSVDEGAHVGYDKSLSADCSGTIALGETKTCTITNDDIAPQLIVIKHVINDNGGTSAAGAFTMTIDDPGTNPASFAGAEAPGVTTAVDPGEYSVSETGPSGYTASYSAECSGSIAIGETKTCTVTNDDNAASLKLRKVVVKDNGGTAYASAWTLYAGLNAVTGSSTAVQATDQAGTFALSESAGPAGYTNTSITCDNNPGVGVTSVTVGLGATITCTFVNNDIPPKLHLRKIVTNDNGGTKSVTDFPLTANGTGTNDLSGTSPVDSGTGLQADTWALSETNVYGYTASAWSCVGGTQSGSNISVGIGGEATCTITNDDQPGTIVIKKIIKPAGSSTSFVFNTTGSGYTSGFSLTGGQENSQNLDAGPYTVKELVPLGWVLTGIGGSTDLNTPYNCVVTGSGGSTGAGDLSTQVATISLKNGDTVTCTFENTGAGVTRTQGFWATHPQLAKFAWDGGTGFGHTFAGVGNVNGISDKTLCGRTLDAALVVGENEVMGGFWSSVSTKYPSGKRTALEQAKMQLLQQLLAAELNASAFGSVPSGGTNSFGIWETALCGTNQKDIQSAQQGAASFNNIGDSSTYTPGTSADSKNARAYANYQFWNILQ